MSGIDLHPDDLRAFARNLQEEARLLRERQATLQSNREILEGVWKDERYRQFEKTYLPAMKQLDRFCRQADDYAAYLLRKADKAYHYLRHR